MNTSRMTFLTFALGCLAITTGCNGDGAQVSTIVDLNHPRLASAISVSNTSVLVTFSEKITQSSAEDCSHYDIVGADKAPPIRKATLCMASLLFNV